MHAIIHLSKPIECTAPRVNFKVNHGLLVIIMCQCRFINYNQCTTLVRDVDNGENYACVEAGGIWDVSIPSFQFCCELKTAVKNKVLKKVYCIKINLCFLKIISG